VKGCIVVTLASATGTLSLQFATVYDQPLSPSPITFTSDYRFGDAMPMAVIHIHHRDANQREYSCRLRADGGGVSATAKAVYVRGDTCYVAAARYVVALALPTLALAWSVRADTSLVYELHYAKEYASLLTWGECEVARIDLCGQVIWTMSGKDIFTNGFTMGEDTLEVVDFNHERYRVALATGASELIG
jgi:hypothetical protein